MAAPSPRPSLSTTRPGPSRPDTPDSSYHSRAASQETNASKRFSVSSSTSNIDPFKKPARDQVNKVKDNPRADPRFYSGKHPVPKVDSLWDFYPGQQQLDGEEAQADEERKKKIAAKSQLVTDPVTGDEVRICDAKYDPPAEVQKRGKEEFPLQHWRDCMRELRNITIKYISFVVVCFIILNGCFSLRYSFTVIISFAGGVTWWRSVDSAWEHFAHTVEAETGRQRMLVQGDPGNESVEWLNGILSKLWPQVNTDIFAACVDLLEDVMQISLPSIVSQVKVVNVGQGTTPMRILSMRWLDEGKAGEQVPISGKKLRDLIAEGEWASLEVAFSYRAQPSSSSAASKAKNANLLIHFFVGVSGLVGKALPVWVELRHVSGKCGRMKVQLIPDPPFVKLTTFTLMGMPKLEVTAVPMNQRFFNVMNLPLISDFIYSSIRATMREYVAPASYTLDLAKILVGDDSKKETRATGVLVVHIHSATGIKASDLDGKSDPYVTLSYSKFAKPLWSTRIIFNELNPIFDETAVLLVGRDEIKAKERLSVELWDSDRFTADDICGRTEMDVTELIKNPGKKFERVDGLMGIKDGDQTPGTVKWDVVYYGKRELNKELETEGGDERMPKELRHLEAPKNIHTTNPNAKGARSPENDVCFIPPDPAYPSGILSIQIHNIVGLERHLVSASKSNTSLQRGQAQATEEEEEGESLPSAYCSIILDYNKIYKTRVKPMTSKPFFNAGCERFVRCWPNSTVLVVVRDKRMRESDPILGVVELRLKDAFKYSSHNTHFYPIRGGVGYGKIRISLLFRSIDSQLPPRMLGADVGSLEIISPTISSHDITDDEVRKADSIFFQTPLIKKRANKHSDGSGWSPVHNTHGSTGFRLGVCHRHSAACVLYFRRNSHLRRDKTFAVAMIWLKDIPDEEEIELKLPVFRPDSIEQYIQNCGLPEERAGKQVGYITLTVRFHRGLGHSHRRAAQNDKDFHDVIEAVSRVGYIRGERPISVMPSDSDSDSDSGTEEGHSRPTTGHTTDEAKHQQRFSDSDSELALAMAESGALAEDGEEVGPIEGIKRRLSKQNEKRKELHRKERGIMQWKGARTLAWVGKNVGEVPRRVGGKLKMEPRRPDVESEVR